MITKLEHRRRARGWTQLELARRAGVNNAHISRFENGCLASVSQNFRRRVARALGLSQQALFGTDSQLYSWRTGKPLRCARCRKSIRGQEGGWNGKQRFWCQRCADWLITKHIDDSKRGKTTWRRRTRRPTSTARAR